MVMNATRHTAIAILALLAALAPPALAQQPPDEAVADSYQEAYVEDDGGGGIYGLIADALAPGEKGADAAPQGWRFDFEPAWTTAVGRAFTFFNDTFIGDPVFTTAVAREFSFFNNTLVSDAAFSTVVAREFSFFNDTLISDPQFTTVVGREFSFFNDTVIVEPEFTAAVAREFSFYNDTPPVFPEFTTAVAREFSFYNLYQDLAVTAVTAPDLAEPGATITVDWTVTNAGVEDLAGNWVDRVYASVDDVLDPNDDTLIGSQVYAGTLASGASYDATLDVTLPPPPATYWLFVLTDGADALPETDEDNNALATTVIAVDPDYTATVVASVDEAPAGTPVLLSGTATMIDGGDPAPFVAVAIRVTLRGTTQEYIVETNGLGAFSYIYDPGDTVAGICTVAADHPFVHDPAPEDTFTLHGLRVTPPSRVLDLAVGLPQETSVTLTNFGETELLDLSATVADLPANMTLELSTLPPSLAPGASVDVVMTVTAIDDSTTSATATVTFDTLQNAADSVALQLDVLVPTPQLVAQPTPVTAGMLRGTVSFVEFTLQNTGGAPTSSLEVSVPVVDWLALASPEEIDPLAPGESTNVIIRLDPDLTLPLGPYSGSFAINGTPALEVPFVFTAVSDATGDLVIEVTDEFTYVMPDAPRVADATVSVRDAYTHAEVASAVTGTDGLAVFDDLNEAYYEIVVTAPDHGGFQTIHHLTPGDQTQIEAFLPRELVSYNWVVVPIDLEDRYEIILEAEFETNVPLPVITIDPPLVDLEDLGAATAQIDFTVTNHGLIAARNMDVLFAGTDRFVLTPQFTNIGDLAAQSSIVVPVVIEDLEYGQPDASCALPSFGVQWEIITDRPRTYYRWVYFHLPPCGTPGIGGFGGGFGGFGGGGGGVLPPPPLVIPATCTPCDSACVTTLLTCPLRDVPIDTSQAPISDCLGTFSGAAPVSCAGTIADAVVDATTATGPFADLVTCIATAAEVCPCPDDDPPLRGLFDPVTVTAERPEIQYYVETANRMLAVFDAAAYPLGDPVWFAVVDDANALALRDWLLAFDASHAPGSDAGIAISAAEEAALLALPLPSQVMLADAATAIARWNRTLDYWSQDIYTVDDVPTGWDTDFIDRDVYSAKADLAQASIADDSDEGYDAVFASVRQAMEIVLDDLIVDEEGVCVRVRIRITQDAVVTRAAFEASLTLENNGDVNPLDAVFADIQIRALNGDPAADRFGILGPAVSGAIGAFDGSESLPILSAATARWTVVPDETAAPTEPVDYEISGTLTYEVAGELVTIPLYPTRITVWPTPRFHLQYFLERTVYSDDPFTPEVEVPIPFALGVIAKNVGNGDAEDFEILSSQPEIIENDSGLLIDFRIIGAQMGLDPVAPTLLADFGAMPAGTTKVARWLMTASLEGEFISFTADFQQLGPLGDLGLSLIEDPIDAYLMHHAVLVDEPIDDGLPDFLTDDLPDVDDLPDAIHVSDGETVLPVETVLDATFDAPIEPGDYEAVVTATLQPGWNYVRLDDPGLGQYGLASVVRSDGRVLPVVENAWTTSRIRRPIGQPPIPERYLHLVDRSDAVTEYTYTLLYFGSGDTNCDGLVSAADIDPFVLALTDPSAYLATYPDCDILNADLNGDRSVSPADIDPFVILLTGGG
jgi:hypothetical protein